MDEARNRYLRDRVMTATPAQRVVMIYDRLLLDLDRAADAADAPAAGAHLGHAASIVAELLGSLDQSAGGPADNLAQLYGYLLGELTAIRMSDERARLGALRTIAAGLRDAFAEAAASLAGTSALASTASAASAARTAFASQVSGTSASAPRGGAAPAVAWIG